MRLDPRRNLPATAAGILGIGLFALPSVGDAAAPVDAARLVLLAAAASSLLAGAWPSRRGRFLLLLPGVAGFAFIGTIALGEISRAIVLVAVLAAYGLFLEYAREGRE
jgi:hypothetical protein